MAHVYPYGFFHKSNSNMLNASGEYEGNTFKVPAFLDTVLLDNLSGQFTTATFIVVRNGVQYFILTPGTERDILIEPGDNFKLKIEDGDSSNEMFSYQIGFRFSGYPYPEESESSITASLSSSSSTEILTSSSSSSSSSELKTSSSSSSSSSSSYSSSSSSTSSSSLWMTSSSSSSYYQWKTDTIDSIGDIGSYSSFAVVEGKPAVVYSDITNGRMKYARWNGSSWDTVSISNSGYGSASLFIVNGNPAVAFCDESVTFGNLIYVRAEDSTGSTWYSERIIQTAGVNYGFKKPKLLVVADRPSICFGKYYASGSASNLTQFIRSNDDYGNSTWGSPVTVATSTDARDQDMAIIDSNPAITYKTSDLLELKYIRASNTIGSSWGSPITLAIATSNISCMNIIVSNSIPMITFIQDGILKLVISTDVDGSSWNAAFLVYFEYLYSTKAISASIIDGVPAIVFYEEAPDTSYNIKYIESTDDTGIVWNTPEIIENSLTIYGNTSLSEIDGQPAIFYYATGSNLKYARRIELYNISTSSSSSQIRSSSSSSSSSSTSSELRTSSSSSLSSSSSTEIRSSSSSSFSSSSQSSSSSSSSTAVRSSSSTSSSNSSSGSSESSSSGVLISSGAGSSNFNGTYIANGTFNGKTAYYYAAKTKWLFWANTSYDGYVWAMYYTKSNLAYKTNYDYYLTSGGPTGVYSASAFPPGPTVSYA